MTLEPVWKNLLVESLPSRIADPESLINRFRGYLLEVNVHINLIARTDTSSIIDGLIFDSLSMLRHINYSGGALVLDIGSGAGFPWVLHKLMRPDLRIVSVDSNRRKIEFQRNVCRLIGLENCRLVADRIESLAPLGADFAIAKAVGTIDQISHLAAPHLKQGAFLVLPRGISEPHFQPIPGFLLKSSFEYQSSPNGRFSSLVTLEKS